MLLHMCRRPIFVHDRVALRDELAERAAHGLHAAVPRRRHVRAGAVRGRRRRRRLLVRDARRQDPAGHGRSERTTGLHKDR